MAPGGTMSTNYMRTLAEDFLFFSGDVQTTTIALAITSSLCCSILWLVVSLVSGDHDSLVTLVLQTWKSRSGSSVQDAGDSVQLVRKSARQIRQGGNFCVAQSHRSISVDRQLGKNCAVPCRRCGVCASNKYCRFILCTSCCRANRFTNCNHHTDQSYTYSRQINAPVEIDLSYLNLKRCPNRVGFTGPQLVTLNLSYNRLQVIPEELGCLLGLRTLQLQYNCLNTLPESLGRLEELVELDLRNNYLQQLPRSICNLTSLTFLKVSNNDLQSLPVSIGCLGNLQALLAGYNQLKRLPESISRLSKLKCLYMSQNPLEQLPETMGNLVRLEQLDFSSCNLTVLSPSLFSCTALKKLWLSTNKLSFLPDMFGRLNQLEELHIATNALDFLPASLACINLYTLNCSRNPLLDAIDRNRQQRVAPVVAPSSDIPPLLEITARFVVRCGVRWRHQNLPRVLELMLENVRYCSCCEGPLFDYFQSQLTFQPLGGLPEVLPLFQQICTSHSPFRCQLRPVE